MGDGYEIKEKENKRFILTKAICMNDTYDERKFVSIIIDNHVLPDGSIRYGQWHRGTISSLTGSVHMSTDGENESYS